MKNLKEAYEGTKYRVFDFPVVIEIGKKSTELDALLRQHHASEWAFITAWNPYSKELPDAENSERHLQLAEMVKSYPSWEGEGVGTDASWKPEKSLLILGIPKNEAIATGTYLEQNAIVYGRIHEPAELLLLFDF
jgi:hypothetical protein